ncbi:MAG: hypothetical protein KDC39_08575 [Actinobacteria bacterium]|nr:hypothetical protein [Actinomycetota bacterium]
MSEQSTATEPEQQARPTVWRWWLALAVVLVLVVGLFAVSRGVLQSDPATWMLPAKERITADSTQFTALVTRRGCNSGVTGEVYAPEVTYTADEILVTFSVAAEPWNLVESANCQGNEMVRYLVTLDEPIGSRMLVDGGCTWEAPHCVQWPRGVSPN